jgi:CBS domain-containing protein
MSTSNDEQSGAAATPPRGAPSAHGRTPKVGDLAAREPLAVKPGTTLHEAAQAMHEHGVGSVLVRDDGVLAGILTERDLLRAVATDADPDQQSVDEHMTAHVVTVGPDWEVYEAAAEMTDRGIRHLVVASGEEIHGVVSVRDVLLSGQRIELSGDAWAVLRDPLTFSVRERRRLQKALLNLGAGPTTQLNVDGLIRELIGSWSFDLPLPPDEETLAALAEEDYEILRAAVLDELPYLQRAVQPAPGWRHFGE